MRNSIVGESPFDRLSQLVAFISGGVAALLGLVMLVSWHTGYTILVQLGPTLAPMQYNAALGFVLAGMGLLALTLGWGRPATLCGAVVAAIGILTLVEHGMGINLGIDQFLMKAYLTAQTSDPGRMGPNSALCFALTGINIMLMGLVSRREQLLMFTGLMGAIVLALGLVAVIGYLSGLKTYSWGYFTDMPPQTALGSMILGGGVIAFVWRTGMAPDGTAQHRFAVLVGIGVLTVTLCLWQTLIASEEARVERTIELAKTSLHNEIMVQVQSPASSLVRMAVRWERQDGLPRESWEDDAAFYVNYYRGLQAVLWIDPTYHVQWRIPTEGGKIAYDLPPGSGAQRDVLNLARNSRQITATGAVEVLPGRQIFHIYVPLFSGPQLEGFIAGVFAVEEVFDAIVTKMALPYSIAIYEGGREIYGLHGANRKHERKWGQETAIGLYGVTWRVRIWPTPTFLAAELSSLPEVVLAVGLLTGVLLMLAVFLTHIAQQRATQIDAANQALQTEIAEHTHTEALLASRIRQMEAMRAVIMEITRELDLTTLLSLMTRRATDLVEAARSGAVYLWDDTTQVLTPHAWYSRGEWMQQVRIRLGEGIVGTVAQRQAGLIVNDYQSSPYAQPFIIEHFGSTAVIAEPLLYRDRLVGVIVLDNYGATQLFTLEDRELLKLFAAQAAIAIENARLFAEIREQTEHLAQVNVELHTEIGERERAEEALRQQTGLVKLLQSAAVAANEARTIEAAMQTVVDQVCAYTGWPVGHVYSIGEEGAETMVPTAIWHLDDPRRFAAFQRITESTHLARGQGLPGRVLASGEAAWITDVTKDRNFPRAASALDIGVRAAFGFPVIVGTEVVAVLEFFLGKVVEPNEALLDIMAHIGTQLGRVVERQRAEEALRVSEVRFRSVVQAANDGIVLGDTQGRIMTWNRGAEAIFGYTEAEVLGQPLTVLMPERYRQAHQRGIDRLIRMGQPGLVGKTLEVHGLRRDGREFPVEMSLATWEVGGSMFCSGIIRDITERKEAVEQLQRQQEALYQREKLAAMGSLLASVAHELNNPLSVITVQAELLSPELKDEALVERMKAISQSAERCAHLVRNFLALARQNPPQRTQVSLNAVVEDVLELMAYALRIDNIEVLWRPAPALPLLWADLHQLHQVVVNLVTNAHQALRETEGHRQLRLTTESNTTAHRVSLEVADTGPGIPLALQERIFEPFFTTKPPGVGTGLGLPFCKGILTAHGGVISMHSELGHGTQFRVDLPIETAPLQAPATPEPQKPIPSGHKSILVVDDEPGITSALAYLLRRDGHQVETAAHGQQALAQIQKQDYDLILCDLRMPVLDGPGFFREMIKTHPHLHRRIIFLTGDTLSPEAQEFLEGAGVPRLSKPFRAAEVRQAIQQAL